MSGFNPVIVEHDNKVHAPLFMHELRSRRGGELLVVPPNSEVWEVPERHPDLSEYDRGITIYANLGTIGHKDWGFPSHDGEFMGIYYYLLDLPTHYWNPYFRVKKLLTTKPNIYWGGTAWVG